MKKIIKTIGWTLLALLVCYGLEVLFRALFGLALHKGMTKQEQIRVQIMANFILKLVVLFVFGFWYAVRENKWHYRPDYRPLFTVKRIAGLTAIGLFGQYAIGITVGFLRYLLPNIFASYDNVSEILSLKNGSPFAVLLLVVVVGPIAEELLFRGVIYGGVSTCFGTDFWYIP